MRLLPQALRARAWRNPTGNAITGWHGAYDPNSLKRQPPCTPHQLAGSWDLFKQVYVYVLN